MKRSISRKFTLLISVSLVAILSAAAWVNLELQERASMRILRLNGAQVADLVAASTRQGMLHNDRQSIQTTIDTLARQRNIERIRVIKKGGQIAYSTSPEEIGRTIDMREEQCISCHQQNHPPHALPTEQRARIVRRGNHRTLGITKIIPNESDCTTSCHAHTPDVPLLGVLDVNLSLRPYDAARQESAFELVLASLLATLLVVGLAVVAVHRMVRQPVRKLIKETNRIASGDLSARVPEGAGDELGTLARQFNRMARDLETARAELLEWGRTLEERVEKKSQELEKAKDQIIQVEKMASLGKLAAVVAHEINNPLSSVVTYAKILVRRLRSQDELTDDCRENLDYLESIASEAARCGEIVSQLLSFARRRDGEFAPTDVNPVVEKALFLLHHKIEMAGVSSSTRLEPNLPLVFGDAGQIQQALMALLINAVQVLEASGGEVSIETRRTRGGVDIVVEDNGPGMEPEVAQHAFEPFFTTKQQGAGVGLGLSVVYGIIERHNGRIELDTKPGKGCRFTLFFPEADSSSGQEAHA